MTACMGASVVLGGATPPRNLVVAVLLENGDLIEIDGVTGRTLAAQPAFVDSAPGALAQQYLAEAEGAVVALSPRGDVATRLDRDGSIKRIPLEGRFDVAVGGFEDSGFAFVGSGSGDVRFAVLTRTTPVYRRFPNRDTRAWRVFNAALIGRTRLAVSYHGDRTTGADLFDLTDSVSRCTIPPRFAGNGCLSGHGAIVSGGNRLYFATGSSQVFVFADNGTFAGAIETDVPGHVMSIATDSLGTMVAAVSPCSGAGKLTRVRADSTRASVRSEAFALNGYCGDRVSLLADGKIIVASNTAAGSVMIIPSGADRAESTVRFPRRVLDILPLMATPRQPD